MKLPVKKNEHNIHLLHPISQTRRDYGKKKRKKQDLFIQKHIMG